MTTGKICTREVDIAEMDEMVWVAAQRMQQRCVGTLVVLDEKKHPVGIVTDRDLTCRVLAEKRDPASTRVGEVMTRKVRTIEENAPIQTAVERMRQVNCRRLPVVDPQGRLVGLISLDDVLILLSAELADAGQLLSRETPTVALAGR